MMLLGTVFQFPLEQNGSKLNSFQQNRRLNRFLTVFFRLGHGNSKNTFYHSVDLYEFRVISNEIFLLFSQFHHTVFVTRAVWQHFL